MKRKLAAIVIIMALVLACGGKTPAERLAGSWEIEENGEILLLTEESTWEFPNEGTSGTWHLTEEEPPILTIYDDDGNVEGISEVVFDGDDSFSFDMEGRPFNLNRVE